MITIKEDTMRNKISLFPFACVTTTVAIGSQIFEECSVSPCPAETVYHAADDTVIMQSIYYYRNVYTMYDSSMAGCMCGEVCLLPENGCVHPNQNTCRTQIS